LGQGEVIMNGFSCHLSLKYKFQCFVYGKVFQPCLIFEGK
jgi:hypothetical protein